MSQGSRLLRFIATAPRDVLLRQTGRPQSPISDVPVMVGQPADQRANLAHVAPV